MNYHIDKLFHLGMKDSEKLYSNHHFWVWNVMVFMKQHTTQSLNVMLISKKIYIEISFYPEKNQCSKLLIQDKKRNDPIGSTNNEN